jgi:antitoxin component YwqK of YwqJK toxin-antitoxin module
MKKLKKTNLILLTLGSLLICSCASKISKVDNLQCIQITDRNGLCETISSKDRLSKYKKLNFTSSQPYKKIVRVFKKEKTADFNTIITSYHPNGELYQYLEAKDGRAHGKYLENYSNGQLRLQAYVIGGPANFNAFSENEWIFDGICKAWDDQGNTLSEIYYEKGSLENNSTYYFSSGQIQKIIPFENDEIQGEKVEYRENGQIYYKCPYANGKKQGTCNYYWTESDLMASEDYENDKLVNASYFDKFGKKIAFIKKGNGIKAIFEKESLKKLIQHRNGIAEGKVQIFSQNCEKIQEYFIKDGHKQGEEILYYSTKQSSKNKTIPKLKINFDQGQIRGLVQTWYNNGQLESQREISKNKLNGQSFAWYKNGQIMLVEEYENGKIEKGKYFRITNDKYPVSTILNGNGVAILFDEDGVLVRKITYLKGTPIDE